MRILLIGPYFANAGHGAECGIYDGLKNIDVVDRVFVWDYRDKLFMDSKDENPIKCEGKIEAGAPYDMILCPGPGLPEPVLNSVYFKSLEGPKVLWNSEPIRLPSYYNKVKEQKGIYDFTYTFDESEIFLYERLDIKARWLPQAFNSAWYRPLQAAIRMEAKGICFIGSVGGKWDNRNNLIQRLRDAKLPLGYGKVFNAARVNEIYNQSKLVLNLGLWCPQSGPPEHLRAYGLQQRIFESIGAGRVCVTNEIPQGSNELFRHNETVLMYNEENLEEIVRFGLDDGNRTRIETNVCQSRHMHTYESRMRQLLSEVLES